MHLIVESGGTVQAENAADGGARLCWLLQILDRNPCPICWVRRLCAFAPWPAVRIRVLTDYATSNMIALMRKFFPLPTVAACLSLLILAPAVPGQTDDKMAKVQALAQQLQLTPEQKVKVLPILEQRLQNWTRSKTILRFPAWRR